MLTYSEYREEIKPLLEHIANANNMVICVGGSVAFYEIAHEHGEAVMFARVNDVDIQGVSLEHSHEKIVDILDENLKGLSKAWSFDYENRGLITKEIEDELKYTSPHLRVPGCRELLEFYVGLNRSKDAYKISKLTEWK